MDRVAKFQNLISDLIKKQMLMLGPNVSLSQARKVTGLTVSDDGTVTKIEGDPQEILGAVAKQYMALSGAIAQMTLDSVISKYPDIQLTQNLK